MTAVLVAEAGDQRLIVSGDATGVLRRWSLLDGTPVGRPVAAHDGPVNAVVLAGATVLSGGADGAVRRWRLPRSGRRPAAAPGGACLGQGFRGMKAVMADNWRARVHPRRLRRITGRHPQEPPPELSMDPRAQAEPGPVPPVEESVVTSAIYAHGRRTETPPTLARSADRLRRTPGAMAWIGLYRPAEAQLLTVGDEFGLHELAVEDAIVAHQRPKLERYGDTLFVVLRAARYLDDAEEVDFTELHLFVGPNFVLTVRHGAAPDLPAVRRRLEGDPGLLARGPEAVLYAVLDAVVDGYAPVIAGLQNDIDEIETQVFGGDPKVSRRIYELSREVVEFQRATRPLLEILAGLTAGFDKYGTEHELRRYLADVADHATTAAERVDGFRQVLADILTLNATLVSQAQNEEIRQLTVASFAQNEELKRVSAWAAILFAPTLIGTVYGMNFSHMPELHWVFGYPFAVSLMVLTCLTLYAVFKHRGWL
ncbi:magnesium and cobalt transport protein CorA [Phytohabitans suffuscus]|uniref:magnesium and cobalt transport protein CorA n=1 Tax=Phytohabitans suffuscus TaxID=624315 RepID=UPI001E30074B|nr:magnesium and cobalt transport protein CorA [Phytohabitans suffuscus]